MSPYVTIIGVANGEGLESKGILAQVGVEWETTLLRLYMPSIEGKSLGYESVEEREYGHIL